MSFEIPWTYSTHLMKYKSFGVSLQGALQTPCLLPEKLSVCSYYTKRKNTLNHANNDYIFEQISAKVYRKLFMFFRLQLSRISNQRIFYSANQNTAEYTTCQYQNESPDEVPVHRNENCFLVWTLMVTNSKRLVQDYHIFTRNMKSGTVLLKPHAFKSHISQTSHKKLGFHETIKFAFQNKMGLQITLLTKQ